MTLFWIIAAGLTGLALSFAVLPLLRRKRISDINSDSLNLEVFRDQMAELEADLASGNLDQEQYNASKGDLEKELLIDIPKDGEQTVKTPEKSGRWAIALVVVGIPVMAVGLYQTLGTPEIIARLENPPAAPQPGSDLPPMEELVERLANRLAEEPDNPAGWVMLGRSYAALNRPDDALQTFETATGMFPNNPELMLSYAEILAGQRGNLLDGKPSELVKTAFALAPDNPNALWMMGMVHFQRNEFTPALTHWKKLKALLEPGGEDANTIAEFISEAQTRLEATGQPAPAAVADEAEISATDRTTTAAAGSAIQVTVSLDEGHAGKVSADDRVFVFARALNGPRMPLAASSSRVSDLPLTLILDDSMAMTPQFKLSGFPQVLVGARISKSGSATPQSGDLEGEVSPVTPGQTAAVRVVIDRILP